jgi:hypothetical protein
MKIVLYSLAMFFFGVAMSACDNAPGPNKLECAGYMYILEHPKCRWACGVAADVPIEQIEQRVKNSCPQFLDVRIAEKP